MFKLRESPNSINSWIAASLTLLFCFFAWFLMTRGIAEERCISPSIIGSPYEVACSFKTLWYERELAKNIFISIIRLMKGFGIAAMIGVPLGIICGTWPIFNSLVSPISVFFRNIPMSAVLPLTLLLFGIGESQKIMFLVLACVFFIMFDVVRTISAVNEQYVQASRTLGASDFQILFKVLIPLSLPDIFGSLRLLFGIAFGYIVLAELVNMQGGIGDLIITSQRQGPRDHVYLILVAISLVAFSFDIILSRLQNYLFSYRNLNKGVK